MARQFSALAASLVILLAAGCVNLQVEEPLVDLTGSDNSGSDADYDARQDSPPDPHDTAQVQTLNALIRQKGYAMPTSPKTGAPLDVDTLKHDRRLELYDKLVSMDDEEEDDIPF